jgi:hypothetical protein
VQRGQCHDQIVCPAIPVVQWERVKGI